MRLRDGGPAGLQILEINLQDSVWGREQVMKVGREGGREKGQEEKTEKPKPPTTVPPAGTEPRTPQTQLGPVTKTPRHTLTSGPRWGWRWRPPWGQHRRSAQGISHPAQNTAAMLNLRSKHEVRAPETPQHQHHHHPTLALPVLRSSPPVPALSDVARTHGSAGDASELCPPWGWGPKASGRDRP